MEKFRVREEISEQGRRWHELVPACVILISIPVHFLMSESLAKYLSLIGMGMLGGQALMRLAGYGYRREGAVTKEL